MGDAVGAKKAFERMRAVGAWQPADCAFVNVLLNGCGTDVEAAFRRCALQFRNLHSQNAQSNMKRPDHRPLLG